MHKPLSSSCLLISTFLLVASIKFKLSLILLSIDVFLFKLGKSFIDVKFMLLCKNGDIELFVFLYVIFLNAFISRSRIADYITLFYSV